jgi:hypothetical protein
MLPNNPYFELLDHPEKSIVYTFKDDIASIKRILKLLSEKENS